MSQAVVDSSALLCLYLDEPEAETLALQLRDYSQLFTASPTVVEARIALTRKIGRDAKPEIDRLLALFGINTTAFTPAHAEIAHDAYLRYGKGRHPAALNYGDCIAYAAAKIAQAELVYVGDDFAQTDLG